MCQGALSHRQQAHRDGSRRRHAQHAAARQWKGPLRQTQAGVQGQVCRAAWSLAGPSGPEEASQPERSGASMLPWGPACRAWEPVRPDEGTCHGPKRQSALVPGGFTGTLADAATAEESSFARQAVLTWEASAACNSGPPRTPRTCATALVAGWYMEHACTAMQTRLGRGPARPAPGAQHVAPQLKGGIIQPRSPIAGALQACWPCQAPKVGWDGVSFKGHGHAHGVQALKQALGRQPGPGLEQGMGGPGRLAEGRHGQRGGLHTCLASACMHWADWAALSAQLLRDMLRMRGAITI